MYVHYMTVGKDLEITRSVMKNGRLNVYIEQPADTENGFKHLICELPTYRVIEENNVSKEDMEFWLELVKTNAHLIIREATLEGVS